VENIAHEDVKWTYIKDPTESDIEYVGGAFEVHPLMIKELKHPTLHPKISICDECTYLVLRFPEYENGEIIPTEVDLLITKNELITVQYQTLEVLDEIFKHANKNPEEYLSKGTGYLVYQILQGLSDKITPILDKVSHRIDKIENKLYSEDGRDLLRDISFVRRDANDFLSIIKPNNDVLEGAETKLTEMSGKDLAPYFNHLKSTYQRLTRVAETHTATLQMLHETNEATVSDNLNKIIKVLTIFSVIVFPLTLFAGIWGMNTANMPLVGHPYDFWIVMVFMAMATFIMLILFKIKKWL
jgi:magnesium transporter